LMVDTQQAGAAEVLYGLGAALGRRGGEDLGLIYLQLSLYLAPSHPLALLSLGDLYEAMKKPDLANKIYERVPPSSPLHRYALLLYGESRFFSRCDFKRLHAVRRSPATTSAFTARQQPSSRRRQVSATGLRKVAMPPPGR
jgi:tetratricopeptide (TPR) repeat protein